MKTIFKAAVLALSISTLAGCAGTPPTPPTQLTDAALCSDTGYAYQRGDTARLNALITEGKSREARHIFQLDEETCKTLAQAGQNKAEQQEREDRISAQNWSNAAAGASAAFNQMQMQQQQQQQMQQQQMQQQMYQSQQQLQQTMQAQQQSRDLQGIANAIRGY